MKLASPKDKSIEQVLSKLFSRFGENNFGLTDYWDADLNAIGIRNSKDGEYLIYISTWQITKKLYFVEIENSNRAVVSNGYKNGNLNEIDFEQLSELVTKYLHLQLIYEK